MSYYNGLVKNKNNQLYRQTNNVYFLTINFKSDCLHYIEKRLFTSASILMQKKAIIAAKIALTDHNYCSSSALYLSYPVKLWITMLEKQGKLRSNS